MIIDVLFFIVLIVVANTFAANLSSSSVKNVQSICDSKCFANLSVQLEGKIPNPALEEKVLDYLDEISTDPKGMIKFANQATSKAILLGLYLLFFALPQIFLGFSLGKLVAKLRIEYAEGGVLGFSQGFTRELFGKLISLITVIGPFLFLFTRKRRSLHDLLSNSIVVEVPERIRQKN